MRTSPATTSSSERAFTLVELVVVTAVLALLLMVVVPKLDHLSPKYRLRAAGREVASTIDWGQGEAIARGRAIRIRYDIEHRRYSLVLPPGWFEGEAANEEEEVLGWRSLPEGVEFERIILASNEPAQESPVDIELHPLGIGGSHIVLLRTASDGGDGLSFAVKFNALLGTGRYVEGPAARDVRFRELEEE